MFSFFEESYIWSQKIGCRLVIMHIILYVVLSSLTYFAASTSLTPEHLMNKLLERSVWMRSPIIFGLIKVTFDSVAFARKRSSLRTQHQINRLKSQSFESENLHLIPTNSPGQSIQGSYSPIDKRFLFLHFVSDILMSNQINTSKEATPKLPKCTGNTRTLVIISVRLTCVNCLRRSMERNTTSQCFSMLFLRCKSLIKCNKNLTL